jgi:putative FmdB family regulatory protein
LKPSLKPAPAKIKLDFAKAAGEGARPTRQFMPLHEYLCKKCGHRFERISKFSDPPLKKCPECGGKVEQLLSAPAVQFKGSGWYVNDYPKKSSGKASSDSESSAKGESGKDSGSKGSDSGSKKEAKPKAEPASTKSEKK